MRLAAAAAFQVRSIAASSSVAASASNPCTVCSPPAPCPVRPCAATSASRSARRPMPRPAAARRIRTRDMNGIVAPTATKGAPSRRTCPHTSTAERRSVDRLLLHSWCVQPHGSGGEAIAAPHPEHGESEGVSGVTHAARPESLPPASTGTSSEDSAIAPTTSPRPRSENLLSPGSPAATPVCSASDTPAADDSYASASTATAAASRSRPAGRDVEPSLDQPDGGRRANDIESRRIRTRAPSRELWAFDCHASLDVREIEVHCKLIRAAKPAPRAMKARLLLERGGLASASARKSARVVMRSTGDLPAARASHRRRS